MAKASPVFKSIPHADTLPPAVTGDLREGCLHVGHLVGPRKIAVLALAAVADLQAPVWLYEQGGQTDDGWQIWPMGGLLNYTRPHTGFGHMPENYFSAPYTVTTLRKGLCRGDFTSIADRSSRVVALPKPSTREIQVFSQYGLVRYFEESARLFPERRTPTARTNSGRRTIIRAWRARQNG